MLGAVRLARSMTILTTAQNVANINTDLIVADFTVNADVRSDFMVRSSRLALVTGVTISRSFSVGMATCARRVVGRCVGMMDDLRIGVGTPVIGIVTAFTAGDRLNIGVTGGAVKTAGIGDSVVLIANVA